MPSYKSPQAPRPRKLSLHTFLSRVRVRRSAPRLRRFDRPAFTKVVSHGIVLGDDGQKMSKSKGNYPNVNEVFDRDGNSVKMTREEFDAQSKARNAEDAPEA